MPENEDEMDLLEELCQQYPGFEKLTVEEASAWLEAIVQDEKDKEIRALRESGIVPLCDARVFLWVLRQVACGDDALPLEEGMERLRKKRRRGHKQQEALDLWDTHYRGREIHLNFATQPSATS